jgi:four helix bundle suffix protein
MTDQMVQAARSGVRNISEGSGAAGTSRKTEMKLTNVARASLSDELLRDYEAFLRQNGYRVWPKDSREALAMRQRLARDEIRDLPPSPAHAARLTGLLGLSRFVASAEPEIAANAMVCAVNQAAYLLRRQLERQGHDFTQQGGFTERLYNQRRMRDQPTNPGADTPSCPNCGKSMVRRTARRGANAGAFFWGCAAYPDCKGVRPVGPVGQE